MITIDTAFAADRTQAQAMFLEAAVRSGEPFYRWNRQEAPINKPLDAFYCHWLADSSNSSSLLWILGHMNASSQTCANAVQILALQDRQWQDLCAQHGLQVLYLQGMENIPNSPIPQQMQHYLQTMKDTGVSAKNLYICTVSDAIAATGFGLSQDTSLWWRQALLGSPVPIMQACNWQRDSAMAGAENGNGQFISQIRQWFFQVAQMH